MKYLVGGLVPCEGSGLWFPAIGPLLDEFGEFLCGEVGALTDPFGVYIRWCPRGRLGLWTSVRLRAVAVDDGLHHVVEVGVDGDVGF